VKLSIFYVYCHGSEAGLKSFLFNLAGGHGNKKKTGYFFKVVVVVVVVAAAAALINGHFRLMGQTQI
jgi:hypothetical protein